jgi:glycosyltransferase involved in cell wall biosynthesis
MTPETDPRYAVIIPHYNDATRLARCLEALEAQDRAGVEVVVADNNSTGPLDGIAERFPWARIVTETRPGAGLARNAGVAATTAPWLFFIDCDCLPAPDWLAQARRVAAGGPDAVTGGRVDVFDETPPPRSGAEAFETVFAFDQERYIREDGFSVTANLVAARAVFEATGPMVVGLSEDVDWCRRAVAVGAVLRYDADLVVSHPTRADWLSLRKKWQRTTAEAFALRCAHGASLGGWILKALLMPLSIPAHLPRIVNHSRLSPGDKVRAAGTLARLRLARMFWMLAYAAGRKG